MKALQKQILDTIPADSIGRYDLLPVLADRELSGNIAEVLAKPYLDKVDIVVAPEALGWLLGEKIAHRLDVGMLPLRRGEKLPYGEDDIYRVAFMDYAGKRKSLEVAKSAPLWGKRVLIVDEWIETGAQIKAMLALLEKFECEVVGIAAIGAETNARTQAWLQAGLLTCIGMDM